MPSYQNITPPLSLMPGDVGFSFNNESFPGSAQAGSQFALPSYAGRPDTGTAVRWQTIFGTAPTAVNMVLQGAMADVDAEYQTIQIPAHPLRLLHRWHRTHSEDSRLIATTLARPIAMKQCMAYRVSRFHRNAWVRCLRPRARGLRFCRAHANSLHGALLGLFMHGFPARERCARRPGSG